MKQPRTYTLGAIIRITVIFVGGGFVSLQYIGDAASWAYVGLSVVLLGMVTVLLWQDNVHSSHNPYIHFALSVSWLLLGIRPALWILFVSIGLVIGRYVLQSIRNDTGLRIPQTLLIRTVVYGTGIISGAIAHSALGEYFPSLLAASIGLVTHYAVAHLIVASLIQSSPLDAIDTIRANSFLDLSLLLAAVLTYLLSTHIGTVPVYVMIGIVVLQSQHTGAIDDAKQVTHLNTIMQDLTRYNHLRDLLQATSRHLATFSPATTVFIALYDDDTHYIDYELITINGEQVAWVSHELTAGLIHHIIHTEKPALYVGEDSASPHPADDTPFANNRACLGIPLQIDDEILGIIGFAHQSDSSAFQQVNIDFLETMASHISPLIRKATRYDHATMMNTTMSYISDTLQDVIINFDRDGVLLTACQIAREITHADKAMIYLMDNPRTKNAPLYLAKAIGVNDDNVLEEIPADTPYTKKEARAIGDITTVDDALSQQQAQRIGYRACLQVPMYSDGALMGLLWITHDQPHHYRETTIDLLQMLNKQVTVALRNTTLLHMLENYVTEQAQLVQLSRISSSTLDLERIIYDIADMLSQMLAVSTTSLALFIPDKHLLRLYVPQPSHKQLSQEDIDLDYIPEFRAILNDDNLPVSHAYHIDDELSGMLQAFMQHHNYQSLVVISLNININTIGLLLLGDSKPIDFNDNDERVLELASRQIAAQVHNARIHSLTEEALLQRLEQLSLIEDIAQQISQALDLDIIIDKVLDAAIQSTQAELSALALGVTEHGAETKKIFDVIWKEVTPDGIISDSMRIDMSEGIAGQVMRTRETVLVANNTKIDAYVPPPGDRTYYSTLAVPLQIGDDVIGVLITESVRKGFFTAEQAGFIKSLAGHAAISIDNANLLRERDKQIETLTRLRSLSLQITGIIDRQQIIQTILSTALQLFAAQEVMLYRYHDDPDTFALLAQQRTSKITTNDDPSDDLPADLWQAVQTGDIQLNIPAINNNGRTSPTATITIPIPRRGRIYEVLHLRFEDASQLPYDERNRLELFTIQLASHLENAALNDAIRANNDRMRAILDATRDGIIMLDRYGNLQDYNIAAETILNLSLKQYIGEPLSKAVQQHATDNALYMTIAAYEQDPLFLNEQEYTLQQSADSTDDEIHVKTLVSAVHAEGERTIGWLIVFRDITEEKSIQDFRERVQNMIIHDLRSPLSGIVSAMHLALNIIDHPVSKDENIAESIKPTIEITRESANNLMNMVDTLHDLPTMSEIELEHRPVDVDQLARSAVSTLSVSLTDGDIHVEYDIDDVPLIHVDIDILRRVFINLLHNALKFTPLGGTIRISADTNIDQPDKVRVLVADSGPGIPDEMHERIFEQFVQIEGQSPRTGSKGSGLGLNFCKLAVEAHDGTIWVEPDSPLSGACIAFTVPIWQDNDDAEQE